MSLLTQRARIRTTERDDSHQCVAQGHDGSNAGQDRKEQQAQYYQVEKIKQSLRGSDTPMMAICGLTAKKQPERSRGNRPRQCREHDSDLFQVHSSDENDVEDKTATGIKTWHGPALHPEGQSGLLRARSKPCGKKAVKQPTFTMEPFFATCASKPLLGTDHCETSGAKAKRGLSCAESVKRRHSALGAKKKDFSALQGAKSRYQRASKVVRSQCQAARSKQGVFFCLSRLSRH